MAKLGDELTVNGVTYVLVDASIFLKLNPSDDLVCEHCALDPGKLLPICLSADCDNSNVVAVYVKKLG